MDTKAHWERVYTEKAPDEVSWFQPNADLSLQLIRNIGGPKTARIIDIGGGASTLVDGLLSEGFENLAVLDLSESALGAARQRLGARADDVDWIEADVTKAHFAPNSFDIWHDRAVFHFLTHEADRQAYIEQVLKTVRPGGHVIVATFAEDGPEQCSGLPVMRYSSGALHDTFGPVFDLVHHEREIHHTPFGTTQAFTYCYCRVLPH